eukprot:Rhum_TRINITY_DN13111_c0_g1::Rhum_TRINITY_DN13111_c0_g1_i1::g.57372::m.57372
MYMKKKETKRCFVGVYVTLHETGSRSLLVGRRAVVVECRLLDCLQGLRRVQGVELRLLRLHLERRHLEGKLQPGALARDDLVHLRRLARDGVQVDVEGQRLRERAVRQELGHGETRKVGDAADVALVAGQPVRELERVVPVDAPRVALHGQPRRLDHAAAAHLQGHAELVVLADFQPRHAQHLDVQAHQRPGALRGLLRGEDGERHVVRAQGGLQTQQLVVRALHDLPAHELDAALLLLVQLVVSGKDARQDARQPRDAVRQVLQHLRRVRVRRAAAPARRLLRHVYELLCLLQHTLARLHDLGAHLVHARLHQHPPLLGLHAHRRLPGLQLPHGLALVLLHRRLRLLQVLVRRHLVAAQLRLVRLELRDAALGGVACRRQLVYLLVEVGERHALPLVQLLALLVHARLQVVVLLLHLRQTRQLLRDVPVGDVLRRPCYPVLPFVRRLLDHHLLLLERGALPLLDALVVLALRRHPEQHRTVVVHGLRHLQLQDQRRDLAVHLRLLHGKMPRRHACVRHAHLLEPLRAHEGVEALKRLLATLADVHDDEHARGGCLLRLLRPRALVVRRAVHAALPEAGVFDELAVVLLLARLAEGEAEGGAPLVREEGHPPPLQADGGEDRKRRAHETLHLLVPLHVVLAERADGGGPRVVGKHNEGGVRPSRARPRLGGVLSTGGDQHVHADHRVVVRLRDVRGHRLLGLRLRGSGACAEVEV